MIAHRWHNEQNTFPAVVYIVFLYRFPKLVSFYTEMSSISHKTPFILNHLLLRSVGASWRVQWLDRCLWSSQSVGPVSLDGMFWTQDRDVAGGPAPITINPDRGHLWNFYCSLVSVWFWNMWRPFLLVLSTKLILKFSFCVQSVC